MLHIETNIEFCILNLHYQFDDNSHTMDAILQNKCERKFLLILETIAKTAKAHIEVEIEPRLEGGLLNRYRIKEFNPTKEKKGGILDSVKVALLTAVFLAPTTIVVNSINEYIKSIVSEKMKDSERDNLEKEKLRLEIEKIKNEIASQQYDFQNRESNAAKELREKIAIEEFRNLLIKVNQKNNLHDSRLKFYKLIAKYPKISSVSTQVINAGYLEGTPEFTISRQELVGLSSDMSDTLKKIDCLSEFFGDNDDYVLKLKEKINKEIEHKQSDTIRLKRSPARRNL